MFLRRPLPTQYPSRGARFAGAALAALLSHLLLMLSPIHAAALEVPAPPRAHSEHVHADRCGVCAASAVALLASHHPDDCGLESVLPDVPQGPGASVALDAIARQSAPCAGSVRSDPAR